MKVLITGVAGLLGSRLASWVLDNYIRAFDPVYLSVFFKSIGIAALTTLICFLIGFPVAIGIASAPKSWKPVLLMIVVLPFWVNLLIRTYALIAVFRTRGFFNFSLEWVANLFGIPFEPLTLLYNDAAVILGLVYIHLPFMILPLYCSYKLNKSNQIK